MAQVILSALKIIKDPEVLEKEFEKAAKEGFEGIMVKKLSGTYQAGARGWNWIKYKKSYSSKLSDTIDCVVLGFDLGQGKRQKFGIGAFLIGVLDEKLQKYVTVSKIGTGLTDEEWRELEVKSQKSLAWLPGQAKVKNKPKEYEVDKLMFCDVWVEPKIVVEIRADEISRSAVHTAGRLMRKSKSGASLEVAEPGLALRFPRLERFRDDKRPSDVTTVGELKKLYARQKT